MIAIMLAFQAAAATPAAERVVVADTGDVYGPTLDNAQRTMIYTRRADRRNNENIVASSWSGSGWAPSTVLPFSGQGLDKDPYLSPDGRRLFFASRRMYPGKDTTGGPGAQRFDLFVVERAGNGWGEPQPLTAVNSPRYDNYPAVARNGNVYFATHRLSGRNDLFRSVFRNGAYETAEPLAALNTEQTDADPFIAPDESYIIFSADSRPGGQGSGDLYVSHNRGGTWSTPESLGPLVNSADYEYTPFATADGRWLYFSRGWGEIWRIEIQHLPAMRPAR